MERSKTQVHNFMNKESFSQFPFSSPNLPPKDNSIKLFGKEFGANDLATLITHNSTSQETKENEESCRKFECNYCCRNFPTSQALGGHQNAHRRERLQAKRPHIQPLSIHRSSTTTPPYHHQSNINSITNYSNNIRFYGGKTSYTSHQTPIEGRPMAVWRFPMEVHNTTTFNDGGLLSSLDTGPGSRILYMHESQPNIREQVSLDLHL